MNGPFIIQLAVVSEEGCWPTLYGLDKFGGLWEHVGHRHPAAVIYDSGVTFGSSKRIYSHETNFKEKILAAMDYPERFKITWEHGHSAGWVPITEPRQASVKIICPLSPEDQQ